MLLCYNHRDIESIRAAVPVIQIPRREKQYDLE